MSVTFCWLTPIGIVRSSPERQEQVTGHKCWDRIGNVVVVGPDRSTDASASILDLFQGAQASALRYASQSTPSTLVHSSDRKGCSR